jgi:hypothetical protein
MNKSSEILQKLNKLKDSEELQTMTNPKVPRIRFYRQLQLV